MAPKTLPAQEVLVQLLRYEAETGKLFWQERGPEHFAGRATQQAKRWNSMYAGKEAFTCVEPRGYRCGAIFGVAFKAHRVIWVMMTGEDPDVIDHANGDRSDNRWQNLSNTDAYGNTRNARRRHDNTSGMTGLRRHRKASGSFGWAVAVRNNYIGMFDCIGQAIKARKEAERRHGFHANHGRAA